MQIHFRVLAFHEDMNSVEVRYYTDMLTEQKLAIQTDENGNPLRCKSDMNISLPHPAPTGQELEDFIFERAPVQWFETLERGERGENAVNADGVLALRNQVKTRNSEQIKAQIEARMREPIRPAVNAEISKKVKVF